MYINLNRNRKSVAWLLFFLFYFDILASAYGTKMQEQLMASVPISPSISNNKNNLVVFNTNKVSHVDFSPKGLTDQYFNPKLAKEVQTLNKNISTGEEEKPLGPGPGQPEMQSFKSVGAENMVDLFTGDFSYNIPLLDVGGYPIGIHYNSGITMDQEASWVGLGWNVNPGAINRSVRGIPDDFSGEDSVEKVFNIKENKTIGGSISKSFELLGKKSKNSLKLGLKAGLFHNTYKGWGVEYGVAPSMSVSMFSKGSMTAGLSVSNNNQTGLDVSPSFGVGIKNKVDGSLGLDMKVSSNYNSRTGISGMQMDLVGSVSKDIDVTNGTVRRSIGGSFPVGNISFVKPVFLPTISAPYTTKAFAFSLALGRYKNLKLKSIATITGYISSNYIAPEDVTQKIASYGYLYFQNAKDSGDNVLLDYSRDKEVPFRQMTPHIGIPSYAYDIYSISGEGIGGVFRPFRNDIGFVFDKLSSTKSKSDNFGLDVGIGGYVQLGLDIDKMTNRTQTGSWKKGSNNAATEISFKKQENEIDEPVYFKNPGEFTKIDKAYLESIGDTNLVRLALVGISSNNSSDPVLNNQLIRYSNHVPVGTVPINKSQYRKGREKRTQVISYLNAEMASKFGQDTVIKSYDINSIPSLTCYNNYNIINRQDIDRKAHHISEITVLNMEGKRYIYGIPVYNKFQKEVSFAVKKENGNLSTGLVSYQAGDNTAANNVGTDNFFSSDKTPAHASGFLLTSILSADYVDVTGNGISEDDQGDAIKFNYSRRFSTANPYRWRAPYYSYMAAYSEGLKSDRRDDRGNYSYGEKEIWYLNSIESKNMIAVFFLDTETPRKDVYGTLGENGGKDVNQQLYRLKKINLYVKADLIKNGTSNAKPVKTVNFEYDYSLCKNHPGSENAATGKLTLRKIWFTYNNNNKTIKNAYYFKYDKDVSVSDTAVSGNNGPEYNNKSYDRWGAYKDQGDNPGPSNDKFLNADYPYSLQNAAKANSNVAAWALNEILSPSGAKIKVTYEADDYAFVQNKRAMQMMEVAGFGKLSTDQPQNNLYHFTGINTFDETSSYIFIKVPYQVNSLSELYSRYIEGINKFFVKFSMNVPSDNWGSGSEMVPCYFEIDETNGYGIKGNSSDKIIWLKPKRVDGKNAFLLAATQFLKMNLYSKAYPYSEPGDNISVKKFLQAIGSIAGNIKNAMAGFYNYTIGDGRCKTVNSAKSLARLNSPEYVKYGGGHRVRKIEVYDRWNTMTGNQLKESVYGKEYEYKTKIKDYSGNDVLISSGVASYEPLVGKDENPFTIPSDPYKENVGLLAPTDYFYIDEPIMESFFPSAIVGYSKVRIRSINKTHKSASGFSESEYYTSKDFPTNFNYTPLIEGESKYTYQSPAFKKLSFFNFNARSYVSISQGFKIELNDMNGKQKLTASYAQNDSINPISFTKYYYRLENDRLQNRLNSKVAVIDSANGVLTTDAEIGKTVELMTDLRQQLSVTTSNNKQFNLLVQKTAGVFPLFLPILIGYNKSEINRYRSAAVTKVINRYGILDSVVVVDKGSKVTTKNLVYDAESGSVLVTSTNNEFNDPIYTYSYPAHRAYTGMEGAYKNIGRTFTGQRIVNGVLAEELYTKYFESGDEIISKEKYYAFKKLPGFNILIPYLATKFRKIWAINAAYGVEGNAGIYFIDVNGYPVTTPTNFLTTLTVVRSGKRNLVSESVGSVSLMTNPVKLISGQYRILIDSNSKVISANAATFKDVWKADSAINFIDTCFNTIGTITKVVGLKRALLAKRIIDRQGLSFIRGSVYMPNIINAQYHKVYLFDKGVNLPTETLITKTILDFDLSLIPSNTIITSAMLNLSPITMVDSTGPMLIGTGQWKYNINSSASYSYDINNSAHYNYNSIVAPINTNAVLFKRVTSRWTPNTVFTGIMSTALNSKFYPGPPDNSCDTLVDFEIKELVQDIISSPHPEYGFVMELANENSTVSQVVSSYERRSQNYFSGLQGNYSSNCMEINKNPTLTITYKQIIDTCIRICKETISPTGFNPYRFGILGNWRLNKEYNYYSARKSSDAIAETNIRVEGEVKNFNPFWSFTNNLLSNSVADTVNRWVWNNEINIFNRKGFEIENKDPLGRYNSGQYGYNKHLATTITQNSKSRNMVSEGFEDYNYKTNYCSQENGGYCQLPVCLPTNYDTLLNNCDTLQAVKSRFQSAYRQPAPDCSMAFTNYFNARFMTNFSAKQVGTFYRNCNTVTSPCGDTLPTCIYDTAIYILSSTLDRVLDFSKSGGVLVRDTAHTGKYSMRVKQNTIAANTVGVVSPQQDTASSGMSIIVQTTQTNNLAQASPRGAGLQLRHNVFFARKYCLFGINCINQCMNANISTPLWNPNIEYSNIDRDWGLGSPQDISGVQYCANDFFSAEWTGYLQPNYEAKYVFRLELGQDDQVLFYINNAPVIFRNQGTEWVTDSIQLSACTMYKFRLDFTESRKDAKCRLLWSNPFDPYPTIIPVKNFYKPNYATADTVGTCKSYTINTVLTSVKPINLINPWFSPIAGTKMIVSAWVRETNLCNNKGYENIRLNINFGNAPAYYEFKPEGNVIEGWQRVEGAFDIPSGASSINIGLKASSTSNAYFDDIRLHPYNANMKSYVFHPESLRLTAELDENNYGTMYEYDDDGTLIRVKKETERGIKTIKETRSALLKEY